MNYGEPKRSHTVAMLLRDSHPFGCSVLSARPSGDGGRRQERSSRPAKQAIGASNSEHGTIIPQAIVVVKRIMVYVV